LEPEWERHITLEFSDTRPLPAKIYAHQSVAQLLFFDSDEVCSTSYGIHGKYMSQRGWTLPKTCWRAGRRAPWTNSRLKRDW
jgi:dCTP deaminase